jgi:hypothetical protein
MRDRGQHVDAEFTPDMLGVAGKTALDRQNGFAPKQDRLVQELPILPCESAPKWSTIAAVAM